MDQLARGRAQRKARLLLKRFCTTEQWEEYRRYRRITIHKNDETFVIQHYWNRGTAVHKNGLRSYPQHMCIVPALRPPLPMYLYPNADAVLAFKLALENTDLVEKVANQVTYSWLCDKPRTRRRVAS